MLMMIMTLSLQTILFCVQTFRTLRVICPKQILRVVSRITAVRRKYFKWMQYHPFFSSLLLLAIRHSFSMNHPTTSFHLIHLISPLCQTITRISYFTSSRRSFCSPFLPTHTPPLPHHTHSCSCAKKHNTHNNSTTTNNIHTPAYSTLIFSSSRYRFILNFTSPNDLLAIFFTAFLLLHTCKTDIHTQISHKPHLPPSTYDSVL